MKNLFLYFLVAITFLSCGIPEPKNGQELVESMRERYKRDWYKTVTFKQATIYYNQDGKVAREQTWFEAMQLPSSLAIKFDSISSGSGIVFKNDSVYNFRGGLKIASRKLLHPLLVLGFSVYAQNPEKTIDDLINLNIDLSKIKIGKWQGKENYIVGDENAMHFYIEKERLLFTKMIQRGSNNSVNETQFNKYEPLQKGWISPEVLFFTNGKMTLKEVYSEIKTPVLSEEIFDVNQFEKVKW
jgi:hypothetical protein